MSSTLTENAADLKFDLFVRSREMEQITVYLENLMRKNKKERETFVEENRPHLESLLPMLVENSNLSLEGMQLDREAAALSMQLAVNLRKSLSIINALFYGAQGLRS